MIRWDYTELSSRELRALSHQLSPFSFEILPPGEEEEEACFIWPVLSPGQLEKVWQRLPHPDGNPELEACVFPNLYFKGKKPHGPFPQGTVSTAKHLKTTGIRDGVRTSGSGKGRVSWWRQQGR